MSERIGVSCDPDAAAVVAGGAPVAVIVTVRNLSNVVDRFDLAVVGVPSDWHDLEPAIVSAFPGESARATLLLKPPRREDVVAGDYPITLTVTSRDDPAESSSATLTLSISPSGGFEFVLTKSKVVGRSGALRAHLTNLSDGAITLALRASEPAGALVFDPPSQALTLEPYRERHVTFSVRPKNQPLVGEEQSYRLTVEATPELPDPQEAARLTQQEQGEFVYEPFLRRWPWAALPEWAKLALMAAMPLLAALALLFACAPDEIQPWSDDTGSSGPNGSTVDSPTVDDFQLERQDDGTYLLTWDVSGADEVRIDGEPESANDSKSADPGEHVLEALNEGGTVVQRLAALPLAAPRIIEFKPDSTLVAAGDEITFTWEIEGIVDRADINGEIVICDSRESCQDRFPSDDQTVRVDADTNFLLTVENEVGFSARRAWVEVTP